MLIKGLDKEDDLGEDVKVHGAERKLRVFNFCGISYLVNPRGSERVEEGGVVLILKGGRKK